MIDPVTGNVVCGEDTTGDGIPDGINADGRACVPIDMYAPSLYQGIVGDFGTQAERDYVFDSREFVTDYEQNIYSAFMTGELFQMPAGPVLAVVGFEYREDIIDSLPNEVALEGLLFGFFKDGGAIGEKFTREYYAEVEFPLFANVTAAKEVTLNLSARHTTDQIYGSDTTYSTKLGWRPVDSLLLRATYGTSYRAPTTNGRLAAITIPTFTNCSIRPPTTITGPEAFGPVPARTSAPMTISAADTRIAVE